jgi:hypothetical protein
MRAHTAFPRFTAAVVARAWLRWLVLQDLPFPPSQCFVAKGLAEDWLVYLLETMRGTIRDTILQAMGTAERAVRLGISPFDAEVEVRRDLEAVADTPLAKASLFTSAYTVQVQVIAYRVMWTLQCEAALRAAAVDKNALLALGSHVSRQLSELVSLMAAVKAAASLRQQPGAATAVALSPQRFRRVQVSLESLITLQLSHCDATAGLVAAGVRSVSTFEYRRHLRTYLSNGSLRLEITDISSEYTNEFIGCRPLLVVTQLTLRCMVTLVQALHLGFGGAPLGPAGTGKTETVKDLGHALGRHVIVTNCSEAFGVDNLGRLFLGAASVGAWVDLDEFNRIGLDVISVAMTQMATILTAVRARLPAVTFTDGRQYALRAGGGIFFTMNPGYAGRSKLPESIKALFRSCAMVIPDVGAILRVRLFTLGYETSARLAKRVEQCLQAGKNTIPPQRHYDFGLRAALSVIKALEAVAFDPEPQYSRAEREAAVVRQAVGQMVLPCLNDSDHAIFTRILEDTFAGVAHAAAAAGGASAAAAAAAASSPAPFSGSGSLPASVRGMLPSAGGGGGGVGGGLKLRRQSGFAASGGSDDATSKAAARAEYVSSQAAAALWSSQGKVATPMWRLKAQELFTVMHSRVGVVVLGPSYSGKSTLLDAVGKAITHINSTRGKRGVRADMNTGDFAGKSVREVRINPKALPLTSLFGTLNRVTGDWSDGVFARTWRKALVAATAEDRSVHDHVSLSTVSAVTRWLSSRPLVADTSESPNTAPRSLLAGPASQQRSPAQLGRSLAGKPRPDLAGRLAGVKVIVSPTNNSSSVADDDSMSAEVPAEAAVSTALTEATWVVMDGPVDPTWIETLNSVMDDTRSLTLENGDRLPMADAMRIVMETDSLSNASPATVSRCGIVSLGPSVVGWRCLLEAWAASVPLPLARHALLFLTAYFPATVAFVRQASDPMASFTSPSDAASVYLRAMAHGARSDGAIDPASVHSAWEVFEDAGTALALSASKLMQMVLATVTELGRMLLPSSLPSGAAADVVFEEPTEASDPLDGESEVEMDEKDASLFSPGGSSGRTAFASSSSTSRGLSSDGGLGFLLRRQEGEIWTRVFTFALVNVVASHVDVAIKTQLDAFLRQLQVTIPELSAVARHGRTVWYVLPCCSVARCCVCARVVRMRVIPLAVCASVCALPPLQVRHARVQANFPAAPWSRCTVASACCAEATQAAWQGQGGRHGV